MLLPDRRYPFQHPNHWSNAELFAPSLFQVFAWPKPQTMYISRLRLSSKDEQQSATPEYNIKQIIKPSIKKLFSFEIQTLWRAFTVRKILCDWDSKPISTRQTTTKHRLQATQFNKWSTNTNKIVQKGRNESYDKMFGSSENNEITGSLPTVPLETPLLSQKTTCWLQKNWCDPKHQIFKNWKWTFPERYLKWV